MHAESCTQHDDLNMIASLAKVIGRYGWQKLLTSFFFHSNDHHFAHGTAAAEVTPVPGVR